MSRVGGVEHPAARAVPVEVERDWITGLPSTRGGALMVPIVQRRMADDEFWEFACHEGNLDPGVLHDQFSNADNK